MAETCGGVGFLCNGFAPRKKPADPIGNYVKRRINYKQQQKIDKLEQKYRTDGLSTKEKIDLAATKIDNMLRNGDFSTVVYTA